MYYMHLYVFLHADANFFEIFRHAKFSNPIALYNYLINLFYY